MGLAGVWQAGRCHLSVSEFAVQPSQYLLYRRLGPVLPLLRAVHVQLHANALRFSTLSGDDIRDCSAGRFGTRGIAITMISSREETEILNEVQERFDVGIEQLPPLSEIDKATYTNA
jgi:hypothetical protein